MILFLDSNILIYLIEGDVSLAAKVQHSIQKVFNDHRDVHIAVSALTLLECCIVPLRKNDKATLQYYNDFFASKSLHIIDLSRNVLNIATQIRAYNGLKTPDALQAACCLSLEKQHLFFTGDNAFSKVPSLSVLGLDG
jgi:predicted nucleic acid-binding protein